MTNTTTVRANANPILETVRAMQPPEALPLKHNGHSCGWAEGKTWCYLRSAIMNRIAQERPDVQFVTHHLRNGDLAVSCFAVRDAPA